MAVTVIEAVKSFYERYPYPGPGLAAAGVLADLTNAVETILASPGLGGCTVLDAGCGTGQRLISLARRFPAARFVGIDLSEASLTLARAAAEAAGVGNICFEARDLTHLDEADDTFTFDLIVTTGVLHHLPSPSEGIASLSRRLGERGLLYCWLYHTLGEFDRLLRRELAMALCPPDSDPALIREAIEECGLVLAPEWYGPSGALPGGEAVAAARDMDAFFHPCVSAFRFSDLPSLFGGHLNWYAINGVNRDDGAFLLDPCSSGDEVSRLLSFDIRSHLRSPALLGAFDALPLMERLRVIELLFRPTGFGVVAGRAGSEVRVVERLRAARFDLSGRGAGL